MPVIPQGGKVLVSGANGYLAMWVVRLLLERGYGVRGTIRDKGKVKYIEEYFSKRGFGSDKLELVIVPDIVKEGAFDEHVKDVDGIAHTASPFHTNVKDPEEFFTPAIQGTVGILKSALKYGSKVQRVVVTSSTASVMVAPSTPKVFSEVDWNEESPKVVAEKGSDSGPIPIYLASKTLAERSAWEFYEKNKSAITWDLSVINPPYIYGPPIHDVKSLSSFNTSLALWYNMVVNNSPKTREQVNNSFAWVDVRDTALGHVLALEKPEAGGERIITSEGPYIWQDWIDAANSLSPSPLQTKLPIGFPDIPQKERIYLVKYDNSKQDKILGIKFHTKAESTKDTLEYLAERGW